MKNRSKLILILLFILQAGLLIDYILKDTSNPGWDQSWHAMISLNHYNQLTGNSGFSTGQLEGIYPIFGFANPYYPPFFHLTTIPFYLILGNSYDSALLTNLLYSGVMIISLFFAGKKMHSEEAGLFCAFLGATLPFYNMLMRDYLIDFALSALVALSYTLLLYTDGFKKKAASAAFGAVFAFGILTKWTFIIYLFFPVVYHAYKYLCQGKKGENLFIAAMIALPLILLWYTPAKLGFLSQASSKIFFISSLESDPSAATLSGILYYLITLVNRYTLLFLVPFLLNRKKDRVLMLNLAVIYLLLTLMPSKDERYLSPAYALFAMATIPSGKSRIEPSKKYLALAFAALAMFQLIMAVNPGINSVVSLGNLNLLDTRGKYPASAKTDIARLVDELRPKATVCIIAESYDLNDVNIAYYSLRQNKVPGYMAGEGCDPGTADYVITGRIEKTWRSGLSEKSMARLGELLMEGKFSLRYTQDDAKLYERNR